MLHGSILHPPPEERTLGYTAIVRLKRNGKTVVSESATFDRCQLANAWMRRREAGLDQQRAHGEPVGKGSTLAELLGWYGKDIKELTPWGRTKEAGPQAPGRPRDREEKRVAPEER